jgi:hypothetical protein
MTHAPCLIADLPEPGRPRGYMPDVDRSTLVGDDTDDSMGD